MQIPLITVEFAHPAWPAPLRYVLFEPEPITALLEDGVTVVTFAAGGTGGRESGDATSGRVGRAVEIGDADLALLSAVRSVKGSEDEIAATVRLYDLAALTYVADSLRTYSLGQITHDGVAASIGLARRNPSNIDAPTLRFSWSNSPALR